MTGEKLKASLLQYAVQGKLVAQEPTDEAASVLLERIRAEKARLVAQGKIKASGRESSIYKRDSSWYERSGGRECCIDELLPFDIPPSWQWVRFNELVHFVMGKTPPRKEEEYWMNASYSWVSIADMIADGIITETKEKITEYAVQNSFRNNVTPKGTLLMSFKLTVGKVSILGIDAFHNEAIISIFPYVDTEKITTKYLFHTLPLLSQNGETKAAIKGNTLNSESLSALFLPLPPLAEQRRIVNKLEELLPLVNEYTCKEQKLRTLDATFPTQLKASLLQYAVQGKLVAQEPTDEAASVLLERIRAEKARLVAQGKIKASGRESSIYKRDSSWYERSGGKECCIDELLPFDIPPSWQWVRLGEIVELLDGDRTIDKKYNNLNARYMRGLATAQEITSGRFVVKNTYLILVDGENSGEVFIAPEDGYQGSTFKVLWIPKSMNADYALTFIELHKDILKNSKKGAAIPHLNKEIFFNLLLPLPPLAEQRRIVDKLEELLGRVASLSKALAS